MCRNQGKKQLSPNIRDEDFGYLAYLGDFFELGILFLFLSERRP